MLSQTKSSELPQHSDDFVGRHDEMVFARAQLEATRAGMGGLLTLEGIAGCGKSRFLSELLQHARSLPLRIFSLRGVAGVALKPLGLFRQIEPQLRACCDADPEFAARLDRALVGRYESIVTALPELASLFNDSLRAVTDIECNASERLVRALSTLLDHLGDEQHAALLLLDDVHWADQLSQQVLEQWARLHREPCFVLCVAAFRPESMPAVHALQNVPQVKRITLGRLDETAAKMLLEGIAAHIDEGALNFIRRLASDNPFMLGAIFRGLVEIDALEHSSGEWRLSAHRPGGEQLPAEASRFLAQRLKLLPEDSLRLVKAAAVIGREFELPALQAILECAEAEVRQALKEPLHRQILIETMQERGLCMFMHDSLCEAALTLVSSAEALRLHGAYAQFLLSHRPERHFDIAIHFAAAQELERAFPSALQAAEEAGARHAIDIAERHYRIAILGMPQDASAALEYRITEGFAEVLTRRGLYREAENYLQRAWTLSTSDEQRASIDGRLCLLYSKSANTRAALRVIERSLIALGEKIPQLGIRFYLALLYEVLRQLLHTLFPSFFLGKIDPKDAKQEILKVGLHNQRMYPLYFECRALEGLLAHLRALNRGERLFPTAELARTYAIHGLFMGYIPFYRRGNSYLERSLQFNTQMGDLWGQVNSLHFHGVFCYSTSRYSQGLDLLLRADRMLEEVTGRWERDMVRCNLGYVYYRLGLLADACKVSRQAFYESLEIGDYQSAGAAISAWSKASGGKIPLPDHAALLQRVDPNDLQTIVELQQARAISYIAAGAYATASEMLRSAWKRFAKQNMVQEYMLPTIPWLATALRLQQHQTSESPTNRGTELFEERAYVLKRAHRLSTRFRNNLPHTLREWALLAKEQGDLERARDLNSRSIRVATQQGARVECMLSGIVAQQLAIKSPAEANKQETESLLQQLQELGLEATFVQKLVGIPPA